MANRTVSVALRAEIADYVANMKTAGKATRDLEAAGRDLRKALDEEEDAAGRARVSEAALSEVRKNSKASVAQLAAAEETHASNLRKVEAASLRTKEATEKYAATQKKAANDVDDSGRRTEQTLSRVSARANAAFDVKTFAGLSVGWPAAAAIGAVGVTASLALVGAGFAGLQVVYAQNEENARRSIANLSSTVDSSVAEMSKGMAGPLAAAADELTGSFLRIRPSLDLAFKNSDQIIEPLAHGVGELSESAMPGLVTATENLQAPVAGLNSLLAQTGAGVTDFFTNASAGADGAGREFQVLGGITRDALGFLGQFLANLANNGTPALQQLQAMLRQAESALSALTATGSGAIGFLQGFGAAGTGMLAVINALSQAISVLPPQVTQFAGSFTAAGLLLSKFGIDATKGFDNIGAKMKEARASSEPLKNSISTLASAAFNPATLATAAFGFGLEILGQHERDAARAAQEQAQRVQTLAQALRESNGELDANVKNTAAATLQAFEYGGGQRNLLADSRNLGLNLQQVTAAYLGNESAMGALNKQIDAAVQQHTKLVSVGTHTEKVTDAVGKSYQSFKEVLNSGDFAKAIQDNKDLATATGQAVKPTTELSSAMDTLKDGTGSAADRVNALRSALDIMAGRTPVFEDAVKAGNDALRGLADSLKDGAKASDGMGKALINADGTINTVTKNGSSLQGLAESLQGSFADAASGIQQMVKRGVPFATATEKVNSALKDQRDRFVQVAEKMGLSAAQAQGLADKYGLIPKEITTDITADTKQAKAAIDALPVYAADTQVALILSANADPATGKINETVKYADGSIGVITVDGNKDPVTGKIITAVQYADGSRGTITIDGLNTAAKNGTISAVRFADGSVGTITVGANTQPGRNSVEAFLNSFLHTVITIPVRAAPGSPPLPLGNADGNLYAGRSGVGFANGGFPMPTAANRLSELGQVVRPGVLKWIGDADTDEVFAPLNGSSRTARLLTAAAVHEGLISPVQRQILAGSASVQSVSPRIVIQAPAIPAQRGGGQANVTINTAESDPQRLAAAVSSQLAWILR